MLKNKKLLILTSLVTLFPMVAGFFLWEKLPTVPEGWNPSLFTVFGPSLTMLAVHWFCLLLTWLDHTNDDRNHKIQGIILWICPVLSNFVSAIAYALLLGVTFDMERVMLIALGLMFTVLGNYMPKCRMNSTIGIKVPWAYTSEENWNATHRMGGRVWLIGGLLIVLSAFLPGDFGIWVLLLAIVVLAAVPSVYSYLFYRKELRQGKALMRFYGQTDPRFLKGSLILVALILAGVAFLMFSGNIEVQYGDTAFTIEASYHEDLTVNYDAIDSIEYREGNIPGSRTMGFGSPRLLMGLFENEEFGIYTRYTYTDPGACIVIRSGDRVLVLSSKDAAETVEIYQQLVSRIGK